MIFTTIKVLRTDNTVIKPTTIYVKKSHETLVKNIIKQSVFYKEVNNLIVTDSHTVKVLSLSGLCSSIKYGFGSSQSRTGIARHGPIMHHTVRTDIKPEQQGLYYEQLKQLPVNQNQLNRIIQPKSQIVNFYTNHELTHQTSVKLSNANSPELGQRMHASEPYRHSDIAYTTSPRRNATCLYSSIENNKVIKQYALFNVNKSVPLKQAPSNIVNPHQPLHTLEILQSDAIIKGRLDFIMQTESGFCPVSIPLTSDLARTVLLRNGEELGRSVTAEILDWERDPEKYLKSFESKQQHYYNEVGSSYTRSILDGCCKGVWDY